MLEANPAKSGWLERLPSRRNLGIFFFFTREFCSAFSHAYPLSPEPLRFSFRSRCPSPVNEHKNARACVRARACRGETCRKMEKRGERIFFPSFFLWEKPRGVCGGWRGGYGAFFSKVFEVVCERTGRQKMSEGRERRETDRL